MDISDIVIPGTNFDAVACQEHTKTGLNVQLKLHPGTGRALASGFAVPYPVNKVHERVKNNEVNPRKRPADVSSYHQFGSSPKMKATGPQPSQLSPAPAVSVNNPVVPYVPAPALGPAQVSAIAGQTQGHEPLVLTQGLGETPIDGNQQLMSPLSPASTSSSGAPSSNGSPPGVRLMADEKKRMLDMQRMTYGGRTSILLDHLPVKKQGGRKHRGAYNNM